MVGKQEEITLHKNIIFDIISKQSGSLDRAVLELIMNAVDANATGVRVYVSPNRLVVEDDGHGFRTLEDVRNNFACFGQPQDPNEAKSFGTFRMGRGQIFPYGIATWRSRTFEMRVDFDDCVKKNKASYELKEGLPDHKGTRVVVEFYPNKVMSALDVQTMRKTIRTAVRWLTTNVFVEDEQANRNIEDFEWTIDDPDFVANLSFDDSSRLAIYNMGVLVRELPDYTHSVGGTFVSLVPLQLNFARNEVLATDPTFKRFVTESLPASREQWLAKTNAELAASRKTKKPKASKRTSDKKYVSVHDRHRRLLELVTRTGAPWNSEDLSLAMFPTGGGKRVSFRHLLRQAKKCQYRLLFTADKYRPATTVTAINRKLAFPVSSSLISEIACAVRAAARKTENPDKYKDKPNFTVAIDALREAFPGLAHEGIEMVDDGGIATVMESIAEEKERRRLTPIESAYLEMMTDIVVSALYAADRESRRQTLSLDDRAVLERALRCPRIGIGFVPPGVVVVDDTAVIDASHVAMFSVPSVVDCAMKIAKRAISRAKIDSDVLMHVMLAAMADILPSVLDQVQSMARHASAELEALSTKAAHIVDTIAHIEANAGRWKGIDRAIAGIERQLTVLKKQRDPDVDKEVPSDRVLTTEVGTYPHRHFEDMYGKEQEV